MRVLITGGCGFIGHHFVEAILKHTDWQIFILDKLTYASAGLDRLRDIAAYDHARVRLFAADMAWPMSPGTEQEIGPIDYILHLAAETHVDNSIVDPWPFVQANVIGTYHMLEYARRRMQDGLRKFLYFSTDEVFGPAPEGVNYKEDDRFRPNNPYAATKAGGECLVMAYMNTYKLPAIISHCHDAATRAVTPDGIRSVHDMRVGDKVFARRGGQLVETTVREVVETPYSGQMIRVRSTKVSHLVTPNHRELIQRSVGMPRRWQADEYVEARLLDNMKDRIRIPVTGEWHCAAANPVVLSAPDHWNTRAIAAIPVHLIQSLFGWFASEGSLSKSTISIAASDANNQRAIAELFQAIGLPATIYPRCVQAHSVILAKYLEDQCGRGAENKHLPRFCLQYEPELLRVLLHTLVAGDGTWYDKSGVYYTKSTRLAEQVAELAMKLGYSVAISRRETWNPAKTVMGESYIVRFRTAVAGIERTHVSSQNYDGQIWCLRTDEGNFFIERDGIISCSGNTMNAFGERQHAEKFIPKVVKYVLTGKTLQIHSNPERTQAGSRFYIHCRNIAAASLFLLDKGGLGEIYNIVGEKEVDNLALAQFVAGVLGRPLNYALVDFHSGRPGHDLRYALDGTKLRTLGWQHPVDFEQSLRRTIEWMVAPEHISWLMQ